MADTGTGDFGGGALATVDNAVVDTTADTGASTGGEESTALATTTRTQEVANTQETQQPVTVSSALSSIKTAHPQVHKKIQAAIGGMQRLQSMFPGQEPFQAMSKLIQRDKQVAKLGGIDLISQQIAEMEELDLLYAGGDPRMIEKMTKTPEGKAAYAKIAPHAMNKWSELDKNSYSAYIARTILSDMKDKDLDLAVRRLAAMIPQDNAMMLTEVTTINNYLAHLQQLTTLPPAQLAPPVDPRQEELDRRQAEFDLKEMEREFKDWRSNADQEKARIIDAAWATSARGLTISPDDRTDILTLIGIELKNDMGRIPGFVENLKGFRESGDRNGYLQYLQGLHKDHIPKIVAKQIRKRFPGKGPVAVPAQGTSAATARVTEPGWKKVAQMPSHNDIQRGPGAMDFLRQNKAILKTGEKVMWD